jgi:hypothetical protein
MLTYPELAPRAVPRIGGAGRFAPRTASAFPLSFTQRFEDIERQRPAANRAESQVIYFAPQAAPRNGRGATQSPADTDANAHASGQAGHSHVTSADRPRHRHSGNARSDRTATFMGGRSTLARGSAKQGTPSQHERGRDAPGSSGQSQQSSWAANTQRATRGLINDAGTHLHPRWKGGFGGAFRRVEYNQPSATMAAAATTRLGSRSASRESLRSHRQSSSATLASAPGRRSRSELHMASAEHELRGSRGNGRWQGQFGGPFVSVQG